MRYDAGWGHRRRQPTYDLNFRSRFDRSRYAATGPREERWHPEVPVRLYGPARYGLGPYHERLTRRRRTDDEVRRDVEEALFYDTWVDADAIAVEVVDGVVVLRGELPSYDEVRYAVDDAWDIDGVIGVRPDLRVAAD